ncbi:hypothetical protein AB0I49_04730 [Streptomyces sp. NPDC050617]|uniref:hypothetical protein n=1 Tax=Streptomyces sp. NPDC050617 TaxID=3154628 RepID=UPI00341B376D
MAPDTTAYSWNLDAAKSAVLAAGAFTDQSQQMKATLLGTADRPDIECFIGCWNKDGGLYEAHPWFQLKTHLRQLRLQFEEITDSDADNANDMRTVIKTAADAIPPVTTQYKAVADVLATAVEEVKQKKLTQQTRFCLTEAFRSLHDRLAPPRVWTDITEILAQRAISTRECETRIIQGQKYLREHGETEVKNYERSAQLPEHECGRQKLLNYADEVRKTVPLVLAEQAPAVNAVLNHATGAADVLSRLIGSLGTFANDYKAAAEELEDASTEKAGSVIQQIDFESSWAIWNEYAETVRKLPAQ